MNLVNIGSLPLAVTPALCLAINNIDYVLEFVEPFVKELSTEDTLDKLETLSGSVGY